MKQYFFLIAGMAFTIVSKGQDSSAGVTPDSTTTNASTLTLGISVANNTNYYGQKSAEATPYIAAVASWRHFSGFYLNGLSYRLLKNGGEAFASAYGVASGFDIAMKKGWSTEIGYAYTYFPKNSPFLQAANPHTATLAVAREGAVTTRLEGNYSFGHTSDLFVTFALSKALTLTKPAGNNMIVFTPAADVTGGTQRFYSYYLSGKKLRDSLAGVILDPIFGTDNGSDTVTATVTSFNVLSYNLTLPLGFQWRSCMLELSTQLSLLSKMTRSKPGELNAFFTASFYYQL